MAGIFDRIGPAVEDNVPITILRSGFVLVSTGDVTKAQALATVNGELVTSLNAASETDLNDILANGETGPAQDRLIYAQKFYAVLTELERGTSNMTETLARTILGI